MGTQELFTPFALAFLLLSMGNQSSSSFTPVDNYSLACGSSIDINFQGRTFLRESVYYDKGTLELKSQKSVAVTSHSGAPSPIYQSATIFWGNASYIFRIGHPGQHWIRLYFYPFPNSHQNLSSASVTVLADSVVLLNDFTFMDFGGSFLFKEYVINITSPTLVLTFIPSANSSAFVNAIEVVSTPGDRGIYAISKTSVHLLHLSKFVLETVYRLNMGDESLTTQNDELGRNWESDGKYMASNSRALNISVDPQDFEDNSGLIPVIAPDWVYATAKAITDAGSSNISWVFSVNPNNNYFVRVHFWDIITNLENSIIFDLFIDGVAYETIVLYYLDPRPYIYGRQYMDFVVPTRGSNLTVTVVPLRVVYSKNAIMNGLEIMKIIEVRTLDGRASVKLPIIVGSIFGAAAFLVLIAVPLCYLKTYSSKASSRVTTRSCRLFTLQEISEATNFFDEGLLLGEGGFGKVYKGMMINGKQVAVKVANPQSGQGLREFQNEIELLSKLSHQNLVFLIGYCDEDSKMILVYEFLANGSLSGHLYGTDFLPLSWKKRLEICIGTAKGLHYLHTGAAQGIIHRDVKTANILLDENFDPKVADFGISRKGPLLDKSHVTTLVKGSFGYLDPEYFRTKYLTEKSDVFSFGMVLMEVICGKPALDETRPTEYLNLAIWASSCQEKGTFHEIIDPNLIGKVNLDSLNKVSELAWKCLEESRLNRPPMGYVLCELEDALHIELASPIRQVSVDCAIDVVAENGIKDEKEQELARNLALSV